MAKRKVSKKQIEDTDENSSSSLRPSENRESKLSLCQESGLFHLQSSKNIFVTGGAGTGKSFLIRYYLNQNTEKKIPILASTGAAAVLVGGRTFHSFFALGIMQGGPDQVFQKALKDKRLKRRLRTCQSIIIDEVSMLTWEVLDLAERISRELRESDEPWGGLRIIAVGDFAQLPPVSKPTYGDFGPSGTKREWAFLGESWASSEFKVVNLKETIRTGDPKFIAILEDLRQGELTVKLKKFLDDSETTDPLRDPTYIFPRRDQTQKFNETSLKELPGLLHEIPTQYFGKDNHWLDKIARDAPVPEILRLKIGARVMIRINDPRMRFVNGSVGVVEKIGDESLLVKLENRIVEIEPFSFTLLDPEGEEVASARNFPVQLAYASTIHKVQGATLDRIHIDMRALWEAGQAYVAASRVRKAEDISLSGWSPRSIIADPLVKQFYSEF